MPEDWPCSSSGSVEMSEWLKTHLGSLILGRKEDLGAVIGFSNITGDPDAH